MLSRSYSSFPSRRRRGIALLVTVILLVFLVLIAVALSSLVRVETQIAVNTDAIAQARQNALMGMNMALGRLQETAGPDRRTTARADIEGGSPNNAYLTGVWDENGALITWLVNGNEDHANGSPEIRPDSPISRILDPTSKAQNPVSPPDQRLFDDRLPVATTSNPRFGPGHVYLVGGRQNSSGENIGSVDVLTGSGYKDAAEERIIVRKTPIVVDGAVLPGKAQGSEFPVGHYAYWVADDGIKASIGSGNRAGTLAYDDSGADGIDFSNTPPDPNAATDQSFLARKYLNGIQLQATRTDLVLRDNNVSDLFSDNFYRGFYGVLPHPATADFLSNLSSTRQINYSIMATAFPTASPAVAATRTDVYQERIRDRLRQRFHDITPKSRAVLTNMIDGGLRRDLSQPGGAATLPATLTLGAERMIDFWRPGVARSAAFDDTSKEGNLARTSLIIPAQETAFADVGAPADTAYYPVVPVISEFEFRTVFQVVETVAAVGPTPAVTELQVNFTSALELWNPYNVELTIPPGENLYVSVPILKGPGDPFLSDVTVANNSVAAEISLERTIAELGAPDPAEPVFIIFSVTTSGSPTWKPGESRVWELTTTRNYIARRPDGTVVTGMIAAGPLELTVGDSELNVNLHMGNAPFTVPGTTTLFTPPRIFAVRGIKFDPTDSIESTALTYYFRLKDQVDFDLDGEHWLEQVEPRSPILAYDPANPMFDTKNPVTAFQTERTYFDSDSQLLRNDEKTIPTFVTLFDLPRQELTSIGALQHLAFSVSNGAFTTAAYRLGSPTSNGINDVFETHFFSTVPRGDFAATQWSPKRGDLLANTALRIFDPSPNTPLTEAQWRSRNGGPGGVATGLQTARAAEYLLIEDAFNINSTSIPAWMGVLGGALPANADPAAADLAERDDYVWPSPANALSEMKANWRYLDENGNIATQAIGNVFFRLPHTATDFGGDYVTRRDDLGDGNDQTRREASFRLGLREFTKDRIEDLAEALVARIQARGRPFLSLTEFIDSGLLQEAIDASELNRINNFDLPKRSTAYLMQGDILQLIAPRLVARSDTFTIRAYGDVADINDPSGETIKARAWLEATVQRIPTKHSTANDPADNMTPTQENAGNFGRQFKVVSLRWLDPEEI